LKYFVFILSKSLSTLKAGKMPTLHGPNDMKQSLKENKNLNIKINFHFAKHIFHWMLRKITYLSLPDAESKPKQSNVMCIQMGTQDDPQCTMSKIAHCIGSLS
jgi:hypothetical protein